MNSFEKNVGRYVNMFKDGVHCGKVKICQFDKEYLYQFIDYIHGGCDISVIVAMDFSTTNGHILNPSSLHYMSSEKQD